MGVGIRIDYSIDGESGPSQRSLWKERTHLGRQREVCQAHCTHDIVHDSRIAMLEPLGDRIRHLH